MIIIEIFIKIRIIFLFTKDSKYQIFKNGGVSCHKRKKKFKDKKWEILIYY